VIIRTALPSELPEIGDIRVAAYRADGFLSPASQYAATLHALGHDGNGDVLVAVADDGQLLGTVMLEYWSSKAGPSKSGPSISGPSISGAVHGPGEAEIRALAVRPAARGQGAGNALLTAIIEHAAAHGVEHLVLATLPAMRTAHRMYEKAGFTRLPERDWAPGDAQSRESLMVFGLRLKASRDSA
jgi:ribosomal protein S18 acetylase RimI-like enzyme